MPGGTVIVIEPEAQKPIAEAVVTLECHQKQFHGSKLVERRHFITDTTGQITFGRMDLFFCDFAEVYAEKHGYFSRGAIGGDTWGKKLPKKLLLGPKSEETMVKLRSLALIVTGTSPNPGHFYSAIY